MSPIQNGRHPWPRQHAEGDGGRASAASPSPAAAATQATSSGRDKGGTGTIPKSGGRQTGNRMDLSGAAGGAGGTTASLSSSSCSSGPWGVPASGEADGRTADNVMAANAGANRSHKDNVDGPAGFPTSGADAMNPLSYLAVGVH